MNTESERESNKVAELSPLGPRPMKFSYSTGDRPLEGYTIKRGIGCGGFGEVYYAISDGGKEVALKLVQRHLDVEMRGVGQCLNLKHPNLVGLYDIKQTEAGERWVVMEHMSGENLGELIERHAQGMTPEVVLKYLRGIADGVGYLHEHGIVHRDLKPGNIFIEDNVVKIGDYGLAKYISASRRSGQTESVGTVHYMAPEVARGRYGKEIDLYALGVMLYEMLTGRVPFAGESPGEILMKHLTAEADLSALAEPFRSVVGRLLAKTPEERYASAQTLLADLEDRLAGRVPPDPNVARFGAIGTPPYSPAPPPPPGAPAPGPAAARSRTVPFHLNDVHGGFSTADGLLRLTGDALLFEIQIKPLGMISGGVKEVRVPLSDVDSVALTDGWFGSSLVIRTTRAAALGEIPQSQMGQVSLRIARHDRDAAQALVDGVLAAMSRMPQWRGDYAAHGSAEPRGAAHGHWHDHAPRTLPPARRLVRPREDRIIKGVCSGIGRHLGIEPVLVRVLYVIIGLLTGVVPALVAYFVLTLCISSEGDAYTEQRPMRPYRLMRLRDDRVWAGVCAGWAAYMSIEPVAVRLLYATFTVLTGLVPGLFLYLAMIFIMPVATLAEVPARPAQRTTSGGGGRFARLVGRFIVAALFGGGVGGITGGLLAGLGRTWDDEIAALLGVGSGLLSGGVVWSALSRSLAGPHRLWPALAAAMTGVGTGLMVGGGTAASAGVSEEAAALTGVGTGFITAAITGFLLFTSLGTPMRWRWFFIVVFLGVGSGMLTGGAGAALGVGEEIAIATGAGTGLIAAGVLAALLLFGNLDARLSGVHAPSGLGDPRLTQTYYKPGLFHYVSQVAGAAVLLIVVGMAMAAGTCTYWMQGDVPNVERWLTPAPAPVVVDAEIHRFRGHKNGVKAIAFNHDGTRLASGGGDHTIRLWDVADRSEIRELTGHTREINSISFSRDGTKIAAAADCKDVRVWNCETGEEICKSIDHPGEVHSVAFNHDGTRFATGSTDDVVRLIDAETGKEVRQFFGCKQSVSCVAFSPDGKLLAAGSNYDSQIRTWDTSTGRPAGTYDTSNYYAHSITFSPDGKRLASRSQSGDVEVWDVASGRKVLHSNVHGGWCHTIGFGPDGRQILIGSYEGVQLHDARTGWTLARFGAQRHAVHSTAFGPDGGLIASGHSDGTVRLWEVPESVRYSRVLLPPHESSDGVASDPNPPNENVQTSDAQNATELTIPVEPPKPPEPETKEDTTPPAT